MHDVMLAMEVWTALIIQFMGLASVTLARCTEYTGAAWPHRVLLANLVIVGAATVVSLANSHSCWCSCGITLALMAVGATLEFSPRRSVSF